MSEELKILIDGVQKAVQENRTNFEAQLQEVKKFGQVSADTAEKTAKIEQDIAGLVQSIQEVKKAQLAQAEQSQPDSLTAEQKNAKSALFKTMQGVALSDAEVKALNTLTNPDGGYLTSADMSGRIVQRIRDNSPIRRYANVKTTGKSSVKGIVNNGRNGYTWGYQGATVADSTTKKFGEWQIDVKDLIAYPAATTQMLEDADYDIEAMIVDDATMGFSEGEAYGFLLGDGVLQPRGLMTVATAYTGDNSRAWGTVQKFKTGANGAFAANPNGGDVFIAASASLRAAYRNGAIFGMNRFTFAAAMKLKNSDGDYIWQPSWNLTQTPFGSICGIPVDPSFDHMADIANDSLSIIVGNLNQAYQIVDRRGILVIRDNVTTPGKVKWYFTKRTGGDVVNSEAVRFIEFKA